MRTGCVLFTRHADVMTLESQITQTFPAGVRCWIDTEQPDVDAALTFYGGFADAVGWIVGSDSGPARWNTSFTVADRDEAARTAEKLGADVLDLATSEWTRSATIRDPQGAELTLSQFTPPGEW